MLLVRKILAFWRLPQFAKLWLLPTWLLLGLSRILIRLLAFRRLARRLGVCERAACWIPLLDKRQEMRAAQIGQVVRLAARYTPWQSNCFPQALTARLLLGWLRIPCGLYFGLARGSDTNQLQAHAWVAAGRVPVTGGVSFDQFTVVGCFVAVPHCTARPVWLSFRCL